MGEQADCIRKNGLIPAIPMVRLPRKSIAASKNDWDWKAPMAIAQTPTAPTDIVEEKLPLLRGGNVWNGLARNCANIVDGQEVAEFNRRRGW